MIYKREQEYLIRLSEQEPDLVENYEAILPTRFKPNSGIPYLWIIVGKRKVCLFSTLKKKPVWKDIPLERLNSVRFENGEIIFMFNDFQSDPDICLPIEAGFYGKAEELVTNINSKLPYRPFA